MGPNAAVRHKLDASARHHPLQLRPRRIRSSKTSRKQTQHLTVIPRQHRYPAARLSSLTACQAGRLPCQPRHQHRHRKSTPHAILAVQHTLHQPLQRPRCIRSEPLQRHRLVRHTASLPTDTNLWLACLQRRYKACRASPVTSIHRTSRIKLANLSSLVYEQRPRHSTRSRA